MGSNILVGASALDFTQNCSSTAVGYRTFPLDFASTNVSNSTLSTEWLAFWRYALPLNYQNATDGQIAIYANNRTLINQVFNLSTVNAVSIVSPKDGLSEATGDSETTIEQAFAVCLERHCQSLNYTSDPTFLEDIYGEPKDVCIIDHCGYLNPGNTELAGIGVRVFLDRFRIALANLEKVVGSYIIESFLLSLTVIFILIPMLCSGQSEYHNRPSIRRTNLVTKHQKTFQRMSEIFLDSAILFSLSVSFTSLPSVYVVPTKYQQDLARGASLFTINTPLCLFILASRTMERVGFRSILICFPAILTFAVQLLIWLTAESTSNDEVALAPPCFDNPSGFLWFCSVSKAVYFVIFLLYTLQSQILAPDQRLSRKHKIFFSLAGVLGVCLTWIDLVYILVLRQSKLKLAAATDTENDWTFGQILALLIWLPVFVECFCSFAFKSSEKQKKTVGFKLLVRADKGGEDVEIEY